MSREKLQDKIERVLRYKCPEIASGYRENKAVPCIMGAIDEYVREEEAEQDPEAWCSLKEGDRVLVRPPPDDGVEISWLTPDMRKSWELDTRIGDTGTLERDDGDGIPWVRWDNSERIACIHQFKLEKIDDE